MRFQIWILAAMFLCTGILQADSGKADAAEKGSTDTSSKKSSTAAALRSGLYRVGIQDELQISVWREPELSVQVVVRPDGMISMPLLNDIPVIGLAPEELRELIAEKLKDLPNWWTESRLCRWPFPMSSTRAICAKPTSSISPKSLVPTPNPLMKICTALLMA